MAKEKTADEAAQITPMMRQYFTIKEQHPDCILFFRLGDFYEMFHDDAKVASQELDLTLTSRDRSKPLDQRTPMCGVPYHSAEAYIARLIAKGYKVAICEQMEDPALAQGLVDRDIIRIVTPGTVIASSMLDDTRNNFICSIYWDSADAGISFCDISTGECCATSFNGEERLEHLKNELSRFSPREAVLSDGANSETALMAFLKGPLDCHCEALGERPYHPDTARVLVTEQFSAQMGELETGLDPAIQATGGLISYLRETQKTDLSHIATLNFYTETQFMELDYTARRNLELTETLRSKEKKGSLLWVLDKTKTSMGHRLIRAWLERPLLSPVQIGKRQEAVGDLFGDAIARDELSAVLKEITDLERLIGRLVYGTAGARDLVSLGLGLSKLPDLRRLLAPFGSSLLKSLSEKLDDLPDLRALIGNALVDEPPFSIREGGFIRDGYNADVDALRDIMKNGKGMVAAVEAKEREASGIKTLKIGYNRVFGYYIEVSKSNYDQVPERYIRKQTLVSSERFITQELKELEHTILSAEDKITALEYQLFTDLRAQTVAKVSEIQAAAAAVAQVDTLNSFATVAAENRYCRPQVDLSDALEIADGRHPVVEKMLKNSLFVPNDTHMNGTDNTLMMITGPNMAGKSTYMRQVALIVLMAQMGSFVPAKSARIGMIDRVFTRIGASDDLSAGQSTFMVEMTEVAELLKRATNKSLLILDEIGRGTSTYDGMSIARAVLEYCADKKRLGAKTLFATHYHELTVLEGQISGVQNYNIAAKKKKDDIIFLRKIVRGAADQSYGIEVAKLAGVPERVLVRARDILEELEAGRGDILPHAAPTQAPQMGMGDLGAERVAEVLRSTAVDTLTPIEALNLLYELKGKL
ncbi:MAG: DNA mismatch repair protein MutS [Oscillospiraceae bacterium]